MCKICFRERLLKASVEINIGAVIPVAIIIIIINLSGSDRNDNRNSKNSRNTKIFWKPFYLNRFDSHTEDGIGI